MQRRSLVFLVFLVFLRKFPEATSFGQFETVDASRARAFPLNDVNSSCTSVDIKLATSINNIYIYIYIFLSLSSRLNFTWYVTRLAQYTWQVPQLCARHGTQRGMQSGDV